jgi:signal transduction histidine kinase
VVFSWAARARPGARLPLGTEVEIRPDTAFGRVRETLAPARADTSDALGGAFARALRDRGIRASVAAPIVVDGRLWGAVAADSAGAPFTAGAEARLGAFARLVVQAIANLDARVELQASRARIVAAADAARRRIERDLHDGAQQRLVAVALALGLVARAAEPSTAAAIEHCVEDLLAALTELRELARGLHPAELTERGLPAALQVLADRSPTPVVLDGDLDRRLPATHETAVYFVAAEALTNVAKYAGASVAEVTVQGDGRWAEIAVRDDGVGGADAAGGSGLRGLADRVEALGGRLTLESAAGAGTTVRARVPVAPARTGATEP